MAARLRKTHQEEIRTKIQASQILNRLQDHLDGSIELSATQVKVAEILLKKTLPDLQSIELSGDEDNPIRTVQRIELVALTGNDNSSG